MSAAVAVERHQACPTCSTDGAVVWHADQIDCCGDPAAWVKPERGSGVLSAYRHQPKPSGEFVQVDPDTCTLREYLESAGDGGTAEWREWVARRLAVVA